MKKMNFKNLFIIFFVRFYGKQCRLTLIVHQKMINIEQKLNNYHLSNNKIEETISLDITNKGIIKKGKIKKDGFEMYDKWVQKHVTYNCYIYAGLL